MKKIILGLLFLAGLGMNHLFAGTFEGIVDYRYDFSDGKSRTMEYKLKGKKARVDMNENDHHMAMIMDMGEKKMIMLMEKQKMYSVTKLDPGLVAKKVDAKINGKFYKASGTKTILGYSCDHYVYEGKSGKSDIWGATGIGTFLGMSGGAPGSNKVEEWVKALKGKGMFPLEMDHTSADGKTMTMLATKVEETSLSADLFEIPAGYKKMPDYSEMMKKYKGPSGEDMLKGMKPKLPF